MSKQIHANFKSFEDAQLNVRNYIGQLNTAQQLLSRVDASLCSSWEGNGKCSFEGLSNENHAILKALIEKTEELNNGLLTVNDAFRNTDESLAKRK